MEYICSETVVGVFLFSVYLATILKEYKVIEPVCQRFPILTHFVPSWSFFAPLPNRFDYFLFYRTISETGEVREWNLALPQRHVGDRTNFAFLWNPHKRYAKSLIDIILDLLKTCKIAKNNNQIYVSLPYLHLLNFVLSFSNNLSTEKIQFMVMSKSKLYDPDLLFLSELHQIGNHGTSF